MSDLMTPESRSASRASMVARAAVKAYVGQVEERIRLLEAAWEAQVAWEKHDKKKGRCFEGGNGHNEDGGRCAFYISLNEARRAAGIQEAP